MGKKILKIILWILAIIAVAYIALVIYRIPAAAERAKTKKAVPEIHSQRLTIDTVKGKNLPQTPDPKLNDSTLVGIDSNNNGIRDDVELSLFKEYPNNVKIRAAALQYAMELQMEFTKVFNSETLVAVIQEEGRGFECVYDIDEKIEKEVINLVFNNKEREAWGETIRKKYMTSYGLSKEKSCDIDSSSL